MDGDATSSIQKVVNQYSSEPLMKLASGVRDLKWRLAQLADTLSRYQGDDKDQVDVFTAEDQCSFKVSSRLLVEQLRDSHEECRAKLYEQLTLLIDMATKERVTLVTGERDGT